MAALTASGEPVSETAIAMKRDELFGNLSGHRSIAYLLQKRGRTHV
jgi:hypothetical protein